MITSYKEMTVGQYEKILALVENGEDNRETDLSVLSVLTGLTTDELLDIRITEYAAYKDKAQFIFAEPEMNALKDTYNVNGMLCTPVHDYKRMTAGQYLDFKELSAAGDRVATLSTLLVPVGHTYGNGYDVLELQQGIRDTMTVPDYLALNAFFLLLWTHSTASSLRSLERTMRMRKEKEGLSAVKSLRRLLNNGAGLVCYTECVRLPAALWRSREKPRPSSC